MHNRLAIVLALLALAASAPMLTACYTTQGAGKDIEAAGQGLQNSAQHNTHYNP